MRRYGQRFSRRRAVFWFRILFRFILGVFFSPPLFPFDFLYFVTSHFDLFFFPIVFQPPPFIFPSVRVLQPCPKLPIVSVHLFSLFFLNAAFDFPRILFTPPSAQKPVFPALFSLLVFLRTSNLHFFLFPPFAETLVPNRYCLTRQLFPVTPWHFLYPSFSRSFPFPAVKLPMVAVVVLAAHFLTV